MSPIRFRDLGFRQEQWGDKQSKRNSFSRANQRSNEFLQWSECVSSFFLSSTTIQPFINLATGTLERIFWRLQHYFFVRLTAAKYFFLYSYSRSFALFDFSYGFNRMNSTLKQKIYILKSSKSFVSADLLWKFGNLFSICEPKDA
jgi:hypothetical protein